MEFYLDWNKKKLSFLKFFFSKFFLKNLLPVTTLFNEISNKKKFLICSNLLIKKYDKFISPAPQSMNVSKFLKFLFIIFAISSV